jgi:predicted GIY-YIG superfamily endonuclease
LLKDQLFSKVTVDKVTIFGSRPPELRGIIRKMEHYFRWFERSDKPVVEPTSPNIDLIRKYIKEDLRESRWIDGLGHEVKLRPAALAELKLYLREPETRLDVREQRCKPMVSLLKQLIRMYESHGLTIGPFKSESCTNVSAGSNAGEWMELQSRFLVIDENPAKILPIPVFSNVKPALATRFMLHLLLSMGKFDTEIDLLHNASLLEAFRYAKLFTLSNNEDDMNRSVDDLLRKWEEDQLEYYPINTRPYDKYLIDAENAIKMVLVHDSLPMSEMPPVLYTSLIKDTTRMVENFLLTSRRKLVEAAMSEIKIEQGDNSPNHDNIPSAEDFVTATKDKPLSWDGNLRKIECQSMASYLEQLDARAVTMQAINSYLSATKVCTKSVAIAGTPGCGKTHTLCHSILYAVGKGLNCMSAAALCQRAFLLGGIHFHRLFCIPVNDRATVHRLAELAVIQLNKKPKELQMLLRLDVLFADELGQLSAEMLSVLDIILRRVRGSSLFMGGVLVIGTIDHLQLKPVRGKPFLVSPHVLTSFTMRKLIHPVRAAKCKDLRRVIEITRVRREEFCDFEQEFRQLLSEGCTWVDSWDDPRITDAVVRIVPRKGARDEIVIDFIEKKRQEHMRNGDRFLERPAEDTMVALESHSDWVPCSQALVKVLNKDVREPQELHFYKNAVFEFTYNSPGKFSNTQIGIMCDVPDEETVRNFGDIELWVSPLHDVEIPEGPITAQVLEREKWVKTKVKVAPYSTVTSSKHGVKAKRRQYGIKHRLATTIHSCIGMTLDKVASKLDDVHPCRVFWERAMGVVLLSRTRELKNLIFVGDKEKTIEALVQCFYKTDQYAEYMENIVNVLCGESRKPTIDMGFHPYSFKSIPIPENAAGYVYVLVSCRDKTTTYVGRTMDLVKRLHQHNSGHGSKHTLPEERRPFALIGYVTGFEGSVRTMQAFEQLLQTRIYNGHFDNPILAAHEAEAVIGRFPTYKLTLVVAGEKKQKKRTTKKIRKN